MQQGPFAPRALPRFNATTDPAATVSSSTVFPGPPVMRVYLAPSISRRDEDGFSAKPAILLWLNRRHTWAALSKVALRCWRR